MALAASAEVSAPPPQAAPSSASSARVASVIRLIAPPFRRWLEGATSGEASLPGLPSTRRRVGPRDRFGSPSGAQERARGGLSPAPGTRVRGASVLDHLTADLPSRELLG